MTDTDQAAGNKCEHGISLDADCDHCAESYGNARIMPSAFHWPTADTDQAARADDELVERLKFGAFCFGAEVCDTNPQRCPCSQRKKAAAAITRLQKRVAELEGVLADEVTFLKDYQRSNTNWHNDRPTFERVIELEKLLARAALGGSQ
jgi:hypothetical protein